MQQQGQLFTFAELTVICNHKSFKLTDTFGTTSDTSQFADLRKDNRAMMLEVGGGRGISYTYKFVVGKKHRKFNLKRRTKAQEEAHKDAVEYRSVKAAIAAKKRIRQAALVKVAVAAYDAELLASDDDAELVADDDAAAPVARPTEGEAQDDDEPQVPCHLPCLQEVLRVAPERLHAKIRVFSGLHDAKTMSAYLYEHNIMSVIDLAHFFMSIATFPQLHEVLLNQADPSFLFLRIALTYRSKHCFYPVFVALSPDARKKALAGCVSEYTALGLMEAVVDNRGDVKELYQSLPEKLRNDIQDVVNDKMRAKLKLPPPQSAFAQAHNHVQAAIGNGGGDGAEAVFSPSAVNDGGDAAAGVLPSPSARAPPNVVNLGGEVSGAPLRSQVASREPSLNKLPPNPITTTATHKHNAALKKNTKIVHGRPEEFDHN
jgi:hypothetical protein